jgi:hypothetical protein
MLRRVAAVLLASFAAAACGRSEVRIASLAFDQQPSDTPAGNRIAPPVTVVFADQAGTAIPDETGAVTVAFGDNPAGATLAGTLTENAIAGVATFPDLSVALTGVGFTLVATADQLNATSNTFSITPGAGSRAAFSVSPTSVTAGSPIIPAVQVSLLDPNGKVLPFATDLVTLNLGQNAGGGTLLGVLTANAVNGVASFPSVRVDKPGTGYVLAATAPGYIGAASLPFDAL